MKQQFKQFIGIIILMTIYGCASTPQMSVEELAQHAVIERVEPFVILKISNHSGPKDVWRTIVSPGQHVVLIGARWNGADFSEQRNQVCNTVAGHIYSVGPYGCSDMGLTKAAVSVKESQEAERMRMQEVNKPR